MQSVDDTTILLYFTKRGISKEQSLLASSIKFVVVSDCSKNEGERDVLHPLNKFYYQNGKSKKFWNLQLIFRISVGISSY